MFPHFKYFFHLNWSIVSSIHFYVVTGYYVYIETSSPQVPGEVARLMSGLLAPTADKDYCFEFWYHMWGGDIADLNVYLSSGGQQTLVSVDF